MDFDGILIPLVVFITSYIAFLLMKSTSIFLFLLVGCNILTDKPISFASLHGVSLPDDFIYKNKTVNGQYNDLSYSISYDGHLQIEKGNSNYQIDLKSDYLERVFLFDTDSTLLIFYEDTDLDGGTSHLKCFDAEYKQRWYVPLYEFNMTRPVVQDNFAYVATVSIIGKINLNTGKYKWKFEDTYQQTHISYIDSIGVSAKRVRFVGGTYPNQNQDPGYILINNETGELIETKK